MDRLVRWGILEPKDWTIGWPDLLEASPDDKLDRAVKMSNINQQAGSDILVAVVSSEKLFSGARPPEEAADRFVDALGAAIDQIYRASVDKAA